MEQRVGPQDGKLEVNTYREGVAQRVGHDLVIEVEAWEATLELDPAGAILAARLTADSRSLRVREGRNGVKPLTDKDRRDIARTIDEKVLRGAPIAFESTAVEHRDRGLSVRGELTMAGATRPLAFDVDISEEGGVAATAEVTQSQWGISPHRALMGALKVRDTVEVRLASRR